MLMFCFSAALPQKKPKKKTKKKKDANAQGHKARVVLRVQVCFRRLDP